MKSIGIIGGGPGGLMTAYLLSRRHGERCRTTVLEASSVVGGKLMTRSFAAAPVAYEAGAAEIYDYRALGDDPLGRLVDDLGLATRPMYGRAVVLDGTILRDDAAIARHYGRATLAAIDDFRRRAAALLPLDRWHPECWQYDRRHPWASRTYESLLDTVADPVARRYLRVVTHADLATEPHRTNGLNGLKNVVMDVPGYVDCRAIEGGMGRLATGLVAHIPGTEIVCDARVARIERTRPRPGGWRVVYERRGELRVRAFDALVVALPASRLGGIEWAGEPLRRTIRAHIAHFDHPGHYLRVSLLFRSRFWRDSLEGSWFTVDSFGGACTYDESARYDARGHGVLGFLLAGDDALALMNAGEATLVRRVLGALPGDLRRAAARQLIEARVHRWSGGVSAQPGGLPLRDPRTTHEPDGERLPSLFLVGGYMFDSTLNGVHRSAELATTLLGARLAGDVDGSAGPHAVDPSAGWSGGTAAAPKRDSSPGRIRFSLRGSR
jgi:monoamine oxidase